MVFHHSNCSVKEKKCWSHFECPISLAHQHTTFCDRLLKCEKHIQWLQYDSACLWRHRMFKDSLFTDDFINFKIVWNKEKTGYIKLAKRAKNWVIFERGGQAAHSVPSPLWVDSLPSYYSQNPALFTIP